MPLRAPLPKLAATRGYGADVHLHGALLEETLAAAIEFGERTGAVFIHPFDHPDVIAGQGTVGLEILEQLPGVKTILVATGGGGLAGGLASAVKALRPDVRVVGVQAEEAAAYPPSLAAGAPVRLSSTSTMADGIAVGEPGLVSFAHVEVAGRRRRDGVRAVPVPRGAALPGAPQAGGRAGRRGGGRGAHAVPRRTSSRRWWRCCPAATSTRCCSCRSSSTA